MTAVLTATANRSAEMGAVAARCWKASCGIHGQGAILFRIGKEDVLRLREANDKAAVFCVCPRCKEWQPVILANIPIDA